MTKQSKKLTPWFSGDVRPVRVGAYQIKTPFGHRYSYWNGFRFSFFVTELEKLTPKEMRDTSYAKFFPWRGLARRPSK